MSEAYEAVTPYWFDILKFSVPPAPKAIAIAASRCISEIQGMCVVSTGEREYVSGWLPSEICVLIAGECRAHKRRR